MIYDFKGIFDNVILKTSFSTCFPYGPQMAATPQMSNVFPNGSQHCPTCLGIVSAAKLFAITAQIVFATGHWKNKCVIWFLDMHRNNKRDHPFHSLLIRLSLVKIASLDINHMNFFFLWWNQQNHAREIALRKQEQLRLVFPLGCCDPCDWLDWTGLHCIVYFAG